MVRLAALLLGILLGITASYSEPIDRKTEPVVYTILDDASLDEVIGGFVEREGTYTEASGKRIILWDEAKVSADGRGSKELRIEVSY